MHTFFPHHFLSAGHFISQNTWIHPRRIIDSYEIIFVLKGQVFLCEGENRYALTENQLLLLEPGICHYGYCESSDVEFYWLHFRINSSPEFKLISACEPFEIKSQFKRILHISNTPNYPAFGFDAAVSTLLAEILFQAENTSQVPENTLSTQIREYIRLHIRTNLTVDAVADAFGYSPSYISKFFKGKYHIGLKDYITAIRLQEAKNMLLTTSLPVKTVARELGYPEEKNFIKFFTYHEQISPSKYRNLYFHTHINHR